ncbi:MAG: hypothetical protein JW807_09645 [Spirochaetes bacterium]|nr:hypothetical protein [Spirochaetota bacterium]
MDKKKIIAAAGIAILLIVIVSLALRRTGGRDYVIDDSYNIKLKDIETYYKRIDFDQENTGEYFSDGVINPYTLKFFISLDEKFKDDKDMEGHLEKVRQYLYSVMSQSDAEKLFAVYRTYMKYQKGLAEKVKEWGPPLNPEDAIKYLHRVQEYRREIFGREAADALFGASVKAQEYPIRRNVIIGDKEMYGAEKEEKLKELNRDMWGAEAEAVEGYAKPFTRYQEKLKIYQKDLSELETEEEKQAKIRELRQQLFSPEEVERLDDVDRAIAENKKKEEDYFASESRIKSDPNLDAAEKEQKIRGLQEATFGEEAEAFRRRQAIQEQLDSVMK